MSNAMFMGYPPFIYSILTYTGPLTTEAIYPPGISSGASGLRFRRDGTVILFPTTTDATTINNTGQSGSSPWAWITEATSDIGDAYEIRMTVSSGSFTTGPTSWTALTGDVILYGDFSGSTKSRTGTALVEIREVSTPANIISFNVTVTVDAPSLVSRANSTYSSSTTGPSTASCGYSYSSNGNTQINFGDNELGSFSWINRYPTSNIGDFYEMFVERTSFTGRDGASVSASTPFNTWVTLGGSTKSARVDHVDSLDSLGVPNTANFTITVRAIDLTQSVTYTLSTSSVRN
jgi:hypothetical protein